jgi:hypothetical protein
MQLFIEGNRTLREIQLEFRAFYPYLKILFFKKMEFDNQFFQIPEAQESFMKVSDIATKKSGEIMAVVDQTELNELMHLFEKMNGIHIRFMHFTKAGWVVAEEIRAVQLDELNEQGRRSFHDLHNVTAMPDHLL